jgi:hypothetical protein
LPSGDPVETLARDELVDPDAVAEYLSEQPDRATAAMQTQAIPRIRSG